MTRRTDRNRGPFVGQLKIINYNPQIQKINAELSQKFIR